MKRRRLDSDDDDDEYQPVASSLPLLQYAVESPFPNDELTLPEDSDSHSTASERSLGTSSNTEKRTTTTAEMGDGAKEENCSGAPSSRNGCTTPEPSTNLAVSDRGTFLPEDRDIPEAYKGLLSPELLNVYFVSLEQLRSQHAVDDKVLAQYTRLNGDAGKSPKLLSALSPVAASLVPAKPPSLYRNKYGIEPGWRWDGVVRGRGATPS